MRTSEEYWYTLVLKHPDLELYLDSVLAALKNPIEVRLSQRDPKVFLFYALVREKRWIAAGTRITLCGGLEPKLILNFLTLACNQ